MDTIIKLKTKKNLSESNNNLIKELFIKACESLDVSIFEPLIDEEQYFQDLDKYRFLAFLKTKFDNTLAKGITRTYLLEGLCKGCKYGKLTYEFYGKPGSHEFSFIIFEENNIVQDIFICNHSSGFLASRKNKL